MLDTFGRLGNKITRRNELLLCRYVLKFYVNHFRLLESVDLNKKGLNEGCSHTHSECSIFIHFFLFSLFCQGQGKWHAMALWNEQHRSAGDIWWA